MGDQSTIEKMENRLAQLEVRVRALEGKIAFLESTPAPGRARLAEKATSALSNGPTRGKSRILLMDDDEMIRELTGEKLSRLGYQPTLAATGEEAVKRFEKAHREGNPFQVVILDLMVQNGMGGKETVRRILEIDPQAKAVISSGYTNDPVTSNFWEYGFAAALAKPYQTGVLEKLLESLTAETGGTPHPKNRQP